MVRNTDVQNMSGETFGNTHNSTTSLLKIHYIQVSETKKITSFGQIDYRKKLLELSMEQMWYKLIEKHET